MSRQLLEPASLGGLNARNRIVRSATWRGLGNEDGTSPGELLRIYEELAAGGVGAIVTGFTSVSDDDQSIGGLVRISRDGLIASHRSLTAVVHRLNCPILVQTALGEYVRRQGGVALRGIGINGMTLEDIAAVRTLFIDAARRAQKAGYDGVQIHAAHGFFLSRFVSPAFNRRTDAYGGSVANRSRLVLEIIEGVRRAAPGMHISMKMNCTDFMPEGQRPQQALEFALMAEQAGLTSIEVSGNGTSVAGIRAGVNEGYFRRFAEVLAEETALPVILVGGWRSLEAMQAVLDETEIGFLSMARPLVREPDLPARWLAGDRRPAECVSCNMCYQTPGHGCVFRMRERP